MTVPKPAETWKHFKGTAYVIVGVSRSSEAWDDESKLMVIYFSADRKPDERSSLIHRPLSMWTETVVRNDLGYNGPRFFKIKDAPEIKPQ